jgi:DNA-binding protein HU-beta
MPKKTFSRALAKGEIVDHISEELQMPKAYVSDVLKAYRNLVEKHLERGSVGEFNLMGLVRVQRVHREERNARNPRTGETIRVPAKNVIKAKPLSRMKSLEL